MARALDMALVRHHRPNRGLTSMPRKYATQTALTLRDLWRLRPEAVACMSPSPLTALPVWLYCRATGARFVIDAHTGAFIGPPWERFAAISRFFCGRADLTIVTNRELAGRVERAGGRALVIPDVPTEQHPPQPPTQAKEPVAVFVSSFAQDEPIDVVIEAARRCPDVRVKVTGRPKGPGKRALERAPANIEVLGFVGRDTYLETLASADVVIALTTRDHTMQRGAYEAIYLGVPVIVSDWPLLREHFGDGGLVTANEAGALADCLRQAVEQREELTASARRLRERKLALWDDNCRRIEQVLQGAPGGVA